MLTINEMVVLMEEARECVKTTKDKNLAFEVSQLNKEIKNLNRARGIMREAAQISCEYYTHEVKNSLQLLQKA